MKVKKGMIKEHNEWILRQVDNDRLIIPREEMNVIRRIKKDSKDMDNKMTLARTRSSRMSLHARKAGRDFTKSEIRSVNSCTKSIRHN
jgi:hypothetical protein